MLVCAGACAIVAVGTRVRRVRRQADLAAHTNSSAGAIRSWRGLPVPFFFQDDSAEKFLDMSTRENDVFMSSLPKGGTTWVQRIIFLLLRGVDDAGNDVRLPEGAAQLGATAQVYPEAVPLVAPDLTHNAPRPTPAEQTRRRFFGESTTFGDLLSQPSPRFFSTHLFGQAFLPRELTRTGGKGKLVVVLRNLKDVLTSLHFFRGEPKDGWLGNEHGPGTLARFISPPGRNRNPYGSSLSWVAETDRLVRAMASECSACQESTVNARANTQRPRRVLVLYYEQLHEALPEQVDRLAEFLQVPLTPAKRASIIAKVQFNAMKGSKGKAGDDAGAPASAGAQQRPSHKLAPVLLRKGVVGDWRAHMDAEAWKRFDKAFEAQLAGVELAKPMLQYH